MSTTDELVKKADELAEQGQRLEKRADELEANSRKAIAATDITVVLDRSGSMGSIADDVVGGFNQFIAEQKSIEGEACLTLVQFDTKYEVVHSGKPLAEVPPLDFQPRGSTALLDAIGRAISEATGRLQGKPKDTLKVFVIITDGMENASKEWTRERIFKLVEEKKALNWQFIFLAANQDAIQTGGGMGFVATQSMTNAATPRGYSNAFASVTNNLSQYRCSANAADLDFSDDDRKAAVADEEK